jgi:hypothetical protein
LVFRDLATFSLRSTTRRPLRCTAITSPSRASSRRQNQFFLAPDAVTSFMRTRYKSDGGPSRRANPPPRGE